MECKCGTGDISKMALDHKIKEKYVLPPRKLVPLLLFSGSARQQLLCAYFK